MTKYTCKCPSQMKLTKRQAQVMEALCEHGNNKLMGKALGIDGRAVEKLLSRIRQRTGITSRVLLAVQWERSKHQ